MITELDRLFRETSDSIGGIVKVAHVNVTTNTGGAGRAAYRLHQGLRSIGVDSVQVVARGPTDRSTIDAPSGLYQKYVSRIKSGLDILPGYLYPGHGSRLFSTGVPPDQTDRRIRAHDPDVVNLHWINAGFVRIETLKQLNTPVIWTLHDMWPFTGGCHYSGGCKRFEDGCGECPALGSSRGRDLSRWVWERKSNAWEDLDLTIVSPSTWLAEQAQNSSLFADAEIRVIPNGIDTNVHRPYGRSRGRELYDLPMDRKLVLFGSADPNDPRKGAGILLNALEKLDANRSEVDVVMFGPERVEISEAGGFRVHQVGNVDEVGLRLLYSAADTFVTPAVEDNLPNTVLESLAAGTPVVGFDIGGVGDMVDHKTNGYLAESRDAADLAAGIQTVLERTDEGDSMAVQARNTAVTRHEIEDVAAEYRELYRDVAE